MRKITPVNGIVLVELLTKPKKRSHEDPFVSGTVSNNLGVIKYSSEEAYPVGQQIYFGTDHESITVEGSDVLAMKVDNILARVVD